MSALAYDAWLVRRLMEGFLYEPGEVARVSPSMRAAVAALAETPRGDRGGAFEAVQLAAADPVAFVNATRAADPDGPPPGYTHEDERMEISDGVRAVLAPDDVEYLDGLTAAVHRVCGEPREGPPSAPTAAPVVAAEPEGDVWEWLEHATPPEPEADSRDLDWPDVPPPVEPEPEAGPPDSSPCDAAAWLLAAGFHVVPVKGKNPGVVGGDWGSRTYTAESFRGAFASSRADGIGVLLGPGAGPGGGWLADVEGDGPEAEASVHGLFEGPPPETLGWTSARGRHRLYVVDQTFVDALAATAGKASGSGTYHFESLPGLEIRVGGFKPDGTPKALQSVCPPSIGADGNPRRWIGPPTVATMPEAVSDRLGRDAARATADRASRAPEPVSRPSAAFTATAGGAADSYVKIALDRECRAVAATPEGGRNHQLNTSACKIGSLVASGALDEREAAAGLAEAARAAGLADHEAAATIRSGMEAGKASPRDMSNVGASRPTPNGKAPRPAPPPVDSWGGPEPIRVDPPPVAAMRPEMVPAPFRPWLADVSRRMQCPPDYPAVAATVAIAVVIGRKVAIRPKRRDDWTVVPNLWGALIGVPSAFKTPAMEAGLVMLRRLAATAAEAYRKNLAGYQAVQLAAAAKAAAAKKELEKAARTGADDVAIEALARAAVAAEPPPSPAEPDYYTSNATPEALAVLLANRPEGVGYVRDELPGMIRGFDRPGREEERALMLETWNGNGSEHVCHRIGRGKIRVPNPCVSVIGCMQPGPLRALVRDAAKGESADDGFLQRFQLAVWPDPAGAWVNVDEWPDSAARDRAFAIFERLDAATAAALGASPDPFAPEGLAFLRFADDAQAVFDDWRTALENRLRSAGLAPSMENHLAKYRSLMPSLALLFHLAGVADGASPGPVSAAAARLAVQWCGYLETHAARVYASATTPDVEAARALADKIEAGKLPSPFQRRDVQRRCWAGLDDRDSVQRAVAALEDLGWLQVVETPSTGGAPREDVCIHPSLLQTPEKTP